MGGGGGGQFAKIYSFQNKGSHNEFSETKTQASLVFDISEWPCLLPPIIDCQWVWWCSGRRLLIPIHSSNLTVYITLFTYYIFVGGILELTVKILNQHKSLVAYVTTAAWHPYQIIMKHIITFSFIYSTVGSLCGVLTDECKIMHVNR